MSEAKEAIRMLKWHDLLPPLSELDLISYGLTMDAFNLKLSKEETEAEKQMERTLLRKMEAYYSSGNYEHYDEHSVPDYKERKRSIFDTKSKDLFWNSVDPIRLVFKPNPTKKESMDEELNN